MAYEHHTGEKQDGSRRCARNNIALMALIFLLLMFTVSFKDARIFKHAITITLRQPHFKDVMKITNTFPPEGALTLPGKVGELFRSRELVQRDREILMDLLKNFLQIAEKLQLTYFIYGGSLMGSWRHHGFIPYDDDLDILVNNSQKVALMSELEKLKPDCYVKGMRNIVKFWSKNSHMLINTTSHWWPFIDISFFNETKTYIYCTAMSYVLHRKTDIFPLHKRPFEGVMVDAPKDGPKMLLQLYGERTHAICRAWYYSHRTETLLKKPRIREEPCRTFRGVYPFVERKFVNGKMEEKLKLGNKVLQTKIVNEPQYCWTPIYSYKAGGI